MSTIGGYTTRQFSETQKFLVLDPSTQSTSLVSGSSLIEYIQPRLNSVIAESTRVAAQNTDYKIGNIIQTSGATTPGDNLASTYLVVEGGAGDFPMLNGNDLLVLLGDDNLRDDLLSEDAGKGASLVSMEGGPSVQDAVTALETQKLNRADLALDNAIWPGNFASWQKASALNIPSGVRVGVSDGVSVARADFSDGITIESAVGDVMPTGMRIQRISGTSGTSPCNAVLTLTERESRALAGKSGTLQFWGKKSSGFTGGNVSVSLQCNDGFEQAITDASGEYTENHSSLLVISQALTESTPGTPYSNQVTIPEDCTQVSIKISVPFSGTAGADDWVQFEGVAFVESEAWATLDTMAFSESLFSGKSRYQATYPYGLIKGNPTFQGTESAVAASTDPVYALSSPVRFSPSLAVPPVFYFQSPTSGTESRMYHVQGDANINGLAYNLSESGAQVRNNDAGVTDGGVYVFHWVAESII